MAYPKLTDLDIYFRFVPAKDLQVDSENYQRNLKPKLVRRIVATFNPRALGSLRVGEREGGSLWVEDGLQRLSAVMQIDPNYELACMIYATSTIKQEAEDFWIVNHNRVSLTSHEVWKARLSAKDRAVQNITATVKQLGLTIKFQPGRLAPGQIECVQLLDQLYSDGYLTELLSTVIEAWGKTNISAFKRPILAGIYDFWRHYHKSERYERAALVKALTATTPLALTQVAWRLSMERTSHHMGQAVLSMYNSVARKKLPDWIARTAEIKEWQESEMETVPVVRFKGSHTPQLKVISD